MVVTTVAPGLPQWGLMHPPEELLPKESGKVDPHSQE